MLFQNIKSFNEAKINLEFLVEKLKLSYSSLISNENVITNVKNLAQRSNTD